MRYGLLKGLFEFKMNDATRYVINIVISMIPIGIIGVFFKDTVEEIFGSGVFIVAVMLLVTAALLTFAYFAKPRQKEKIGMLDAFIIGVSQACAVLPGLSLGHDYCNGSSAWQQEGVFGAVLVPHGHPPNLG